MMRNTLKVFVLLLMIAMVQSCGTKAKEQEAESTQSKENKTISLSEKRANIEVKEAELRELRKKRHQAFILETPFYTNDAGTVVYNKSEVAPSYIGGDNAMKKYLSDNLVYPENAKADGLEGTVYVDFLIANDGQVSNVTAAAATWENVDQQFNTEAMRVVSSMPKWTPGMQNGEAVHVAYSVPITFRMN